MLHLRFEHLNGSLIVTPLEPRLDAGCALELRDRVADQARGRRRVVVSLDRPEVKAGALARVAESERR